MSFLNQLFSGFVVLVLFSACNHQKGQEGSKSTTVALVKTDQNMALPLDAETPNISVGLAYFKTDKSWLFNWNPRTNSLQMYNLDEECLYKKIAFESEGEEGVGRILGFYVHDLDSIFLFPQNKGEIFLTDTSGVIKKEISYEVPLYHTAAFVLTSYFASSPVIRDGKMIVKTHVDGDHKAITGKELSKRHLVYRIDLEDGEVRLLSHQYPEDYLEEGKRHFEASFAATSDQFVYSLFADHKLYYADSEGQELKAKDAGSRYINEGFENYPMVGNRLETYRYFYGSSHYGSILYDSYREVYYRFCYPKVEVDGEEEVLELRQYPKKFSILILDKGLNVLGETLFEEGKYYPDNAFITEDGLYLSINHADNPRNKEDYLGFDLFRLE